MGCLRGPCKDCGAMARDGVCTECKQEKIMNLADYVCDRLRGEHDNWDMHGDSIVNDSRDLVLYIGAGVAHIRLENPKVEFSYLERRRIYKAVKDNIIMRSSGYIVLDDSVVSMEDSSSKYSHVDKTLAILNLAQLIFWWMNS